MPELILFDLDGTLADTAPDMAAALNGLRGEHDLEPLPFARIRPQVSHGSPALLRLGFGVERDDDAYAALRERFLALYEQALCRDTRLFAGVPELLAALTARGLRWGIVTNKPGWLSRPLLAQLGLESDCACLVTGDCLPRNKPHPDPLLEACRLAGCAPGAAAYLGDAERDIQAARAAGMPGLVALYGYLGPEEDPARWRAAALLERPGALLDWLDGMPAEGGLGGVS